MNQLVLIRATRNRWKLCSVLPRSYLMLLAAAVSFSGNRFLRQLLVVRSQVTDGSGDENHSLDMYSVETRHFYSPLHWFWQRLREVIWILCSAFVHSPDRKSVMLVQSTRAHPTWHRSAIVLKSAGASASVSTVDLHLNLYPLTAHFVKWAKISVMTARVTGKTTVA